MALPGLNPKSTRRVNRITAGGGVSDSNDFFGEGKVKPDRRDNPLSSKMREPKSINLNSSYTAMNMNDPVLSKLRNDKNMHSF
uniref:Uncharacterized protein n=1 Tax=Lepeophtheirus salmonis TaxID=72036 RepID=A0A0K2UQ07_LEPSM